MWHALLLTRSNVNVVTLCVGHGLALSGQWGIVVNLDIVEIHPRQILDVRFQFIRQASFVLCHRNPLAKITANPTEIRSSIPVGLVCHNTESLIRFDSLASSPSRRIAAGRQLEGLRSRQKRRGYSRSVAVRPECGPSP
jgi:hypothetical protein